MTNPTPASFEAWNEEMSRKYNPENYHNSSNPLLRFIVHRRTKDILSPLAIQKTDRVLDVGCGAGNMLERIEAERTGIDLSQTMIERARRKLGPDVDLRKMSAEALDFPDSSFDKVLCSEVIEHLLNPEAVLKEIGRVLKPGGLAAVSIPNEFLLKWTKSLLHAAHLKVLMRNDGQTNVEDVDNEWHLHNASLALFRSWEKSARDLHGALKTIRVIRSPFFFIPFHYVFLLTKD